jgi:hypothetical protein
MPSQQGELMRLVKLIFIVALADAFVGHAAGKNKVPPQAGSLAPTADGAVPPA